MSKPIVIKVAIKDTLILGEGLKDGVSKGRVDTKPGYPIIPKPRFDGGTII